MRWRPRGPRRPAGPEIAGPAPPMRPAVREVAIRDDTIRLGQFLKLADLIDHGSEAKPLVQGGEVVVNGEVETRRGAQLRPGDEVTLAGVTVRVARRAPGSADGPEGDGLPW